MHDPIHARELGSGPAGPGAAKRRRGLRGSWLRRGLAVACLCLLFPAYGTSAERAVDLELVLAADISRSMDLGEAALVRQGFVRALRHPAVIGAIQRGRLGRIAVTYVEWANEYYQHTLVDWTEIGDAASAAAFAVPFKNSRRPSGLVCIRIFSSCSG